MYTCKEIMPIREVFQFKHTAATLIRETGANGKTRTNVARRRPVSIPIIFDFVSETVTIGALTYKTRENREFTYRIMKSPKIIEVGSYEGFVRFVKQASDPSSVWHLNTWRIIKTLAGEQIQELS